MDKIVTLLPSLGQCLTSRIHIFSQVIEVIISFLALLSYFHLQRYQVDIFPSLMLELSLVLRNPNCTTPLLF